MISKLYTLGCLVTPGGQINQIQSHSLSHGVETMTLRGDGSPDARFIAVINQQPVISFTTTALVRALTLCGFAGYAIAAATDLWFQKYAAGGTRQTGTNSLKATISKGILIPKTLSARMKQYATLSMEATAISTDGTTAPLAFTTGASMPSLTDIDQAWTIGPASINGTAITGLQSLEVDFGIQLIVIGGDGEAYPTFAAIQSRDPKITIRSTDLDLQSAASLGQFTAQAVTDSAFFLWKCQENGMRVAKATTEHLSFSVDDGMVSMREVPSEDGQHTELEIVVEPTFDGTNDSIAVSLATAIS